jgi:tetratricopeptide (TPR) repeat protein
MFDGQSNVALAAAREIPKQVPEAMLREQVDFLDAFMPTDLHVLVRFGKWDAILNAPEPAEYLPMSRSIWRYARAIAYASTNRVAEAEGEYQSFLEMKTQVPETSYLFQNPSLEVLKVAQAMMEGEIAYRRGDYAVAFNRLKMAVKLDDALNYDEPWGWMQPVRHALGALLVEQGRYDEALVVYTQDLKLHPKNPWALHGMAECLTKLGRKDEAEQRREEYRTACQRSDVAIDRSCYCRLSVD